MTKQDKTIKLSPFKLKLEVGKEYRTLGGARVKITEIKVGAPFPIEGFEVIDGVTDPDYISNWQWRSWRRSGEYQPAADGVHRLDIIKPW